MSDREMTKLKSEVIEAARKRMTDKEWFRGVNVTLLTSEYNTDEKIREAGFDHVVDAIVLDTEFWDSWV